MATEAIPVPGTQATTAAPEGAKAAGAYTGWAEWQRAVNVTYQQQLSKAAGLLAATERVLSGG